MKSEDEIADELREVQLEMQQALGTLRTLANKTEHLIRTLQDYPHSEDEENFQEFMLIEASYINLRGITKGEVLPFLKSVLAEIKIVANGYFSLVEWVKEINGIFTTGKNRGQENLYGDSRQRKDIDNRTTFDRKNDDCEADSESTKTSSHNPV